LLIDLGALTCTARAPRCDSCPVAVVCAWRGRGSDPAARPASARPSHFVGSDREGRGRLVAALRSGPVAVCDAAAVAGWPDDPARARCVTDALVAEGLAVRDGATVRLPGPEL
jgi:A/G-specific adenine glycosylase